MLVDISARVQINKIYNKAVCLAIYPDAQITDVVY